MDALGGELRGCESEENPGRVYRVEKGSGVAHHHPTVTDVLTVAVGQLAEAERPSLPRRGAQPLTQPRAAVYLTHEDGLVS